jgi:hypothetical protein
MDFTVGMLVIHPAKPEWGPGKVLKVGGKKVEVAFRDLPARDIKLLHADISGLVAVPEQTDPALDQLLLSKTVQGISGTPRKRQNNSGKSVLPKNWKPDDKVLSVPVGETGHFIASYRVHACPDNYSYRPTEYITFRATGGVMSEMFRIREEQILVLDPFDDDALSDHHSKEYYGRLKGYIDSRRRQRSFSKEPYRFYILADGDLITLQHKPAMLTNSQGHCYFIADDLTSGNKIVEVASAASPSTKTK